MVDAELGRDLLSFGVPLLVLGDPAQLPPIQGGGFFTNAEPDAMLTEVHRQAQDDPIVRLSMDVREGRAIELGKYGETEVVRRERPRSAIACMQADQVLVGRNNTRRAYNMRMREQQRIDRSAAGRRRQARLPAQQPQEGPVQRRAVGVKARAQSKSRIVTMRLVPDEELAAKVVKVSVRPECFEGGIEEIDWEQRKPYDEFDYGYVLTVHKAQGSQWDDVVLFDESFAFQDSRARWLYTGITRAAKRLSIVVT